MEMSPKQWFVKLVETQKETSSLSGDYFFIPNTKHNLMSWWVELNQISSKISYQLCKIQITILLKFISMVSYFSCSPHTVWTVNDVTEENPMKTPLPLQIIPIISINRKSILFSLVSLRASSVTSLMVCTVLEPVCCKKRPKIVPGQLLVWGIRTLWRFWMVPNWS